MNDKIIIQGARENNLKNVNLTIPRDKLVVSPDFPVPASPVWPSIPFKPRDRDGRGRA